MENSLMLTRLDKIVVAITILYGLQLGLWPLRRLLVDWPVSGDNSYAQLFRLLPLLPLTVFMVFRFYDFLGRREVDTLVARSASTILVVGLTVGTVIAGLGLLQDVAKVAIHPLLSSWRGGSLALLQLIAIFALLRHKTRAGEALILAAFASFFVMGFWETLYQTANYFFVYYNYYPIEGLYGEYVQTAPYILTSIAVFGYYSIKHRDTLRLSRWTIIAFTLFAVYWLVWIGTGYWIEVFDNKELDPPQWVYSEPFGLVEKLKMLLGRGSKPILATAIALYLWDIYKHKESKNVSSPTS